MYNSEILNYANNLCQNDENFILNNLENNVSLLQFVSPDLKKDSKFMTKAIGKNIKSIQYAPNKLFGNKKFMKESLIQVKKNTPIIKLDTCKKFDNEEFIKYLFDYIRYYNMCNIDYIFKNISNRVYRNSDFILEIINKCCSYIYITPFIIKYIPKESKDDEKFIFNLVQINDIHELRFASNRLKSNEDFIIKLLQETDLRDDGGNASYFEYISDTLINNKEFIINFLNIIKLSYDGYCNIINNISDELKNNTDIILTFFRNFGSTIFINERDNILTDNKEFILQVFKFNNDSCEILCYLSPRLQDDYDIVMESIKLFPLSLEDASKRLQDKREIVLEAYKQNVYSLQYASFRLKIHFNNYIKRKNYLLFLFQNNFLQKINDNISINIINNKKINSSSIFSLDIIQVTIASFI